MSAAPAHAGHWLVETIYVAPVVVIVVWISIRTLLDRRRERAVTPAPAPEDRGPAPPA